MPRGCLIVIAVVVLLFLGLPFVFNFLVDFLWFDSQHLSSVYTTRVSVQGLVFIIALIIAAAFLLINLQIARRGSVPSQLFPGQELNVSPNQLRAIVWGIAFIFGIFFAIGASGNWENVLRFLNGSSFGNNDPIFNEDVGFYVFTLPFYDALRGWFSALLLVSIIAVAAVYISGARLVGQEGTTIKLPRIFGVSEPVVIPIAVPNAMRVHLSILAALYLATFAIGYRLDQYKLLFSDHTVLYGADYTDINAKLPGYWILLVVASISAILLLLNIRFRTLSLFAGAIGLWIIAAILVGAVYPGIVENFIVKPSQISLEAPYITNNITATRQAFNLNSITVRPDNVQPLSQADLTASPQTVANLRLWDYSPLLQTYSQRQTLETYYDFNDVDIDRYNINGNYRQVMLSARELNTNGLPPNAQSWVNQKLQYTHGYGVAMNPVNEIGPSGQPNFIIGGVPPTSTVGLNITRPEIYFGENPENYIIVNTGQPEFDYRSSTTGDVRSTYTGTAGVAMDSFWKKALFAYHFGDGNILLSNYIQDQSRIIFNRNIADRIIKVAPFLLLDNDPYITLIGGKLYWIQDAYTYSDAYPYSRPFVDPNSTDVSFNYIRNSVKIVIDAYNGDMTFYNFDPSDPLVQTYSKIFPSLFTPASQMPAEIRAHLRYPEYLFNAQAEQYRTYHMTDPTEFYNQADAWDIPTDPHAGSGHRVLNGQPQGRMEAYYVILRVPGEQKEEFLLMLPYNPRNKKNMVAWMAAKSDGVDYGKITAVTFPRQLQIDGPEQVNARINQDPEISSLVTLLSQSGSGIIYGNLLVIPTGNSLLYVQPLYVQATQSPQPTLARILVASGTQVAMGTDLQGALTTLFGKIAAAGGGGLGSGTVVSGTPTAGTPVAGTPVVQPTTPPLPQGTPGVNADASLPTDQLIVATQRHYQSAQAALAQTPPDWVTYGREQTALKADLDLLAGRLTISITPTPVK